MEYLDENLLRYYTLDDQRDCLGTHFPDHCCCPRRMLGVKVDESVSHRGCRGRSLYTLERPATYPMAKNPQVYKMGYLLNYKLSELFLVVPYFLPLNLGSHSPCLSFRVLFQCSWPPQGSYPILLFWLNLLPGVFWIPGSVSALSG